MKKLLVLGTLAFLVACTDTPTQPAMDLDDIQPQMAVGGALVLHDAGDIDYCEDAPSENWNVTVCWKGRYTLQTVTNPGGNRSAFYKRKGEITATLTFPDGTQLYTGTADWSASWSHHFKNGEQHVWSSSDSQKWTYTYTNGMTQDCFFTLFYHLANGKFTQEFSDYYCEELK